MELFTLFLNVHQQNCNEFLLKYLWSELTIVLIIFKLKDENKIIFPYPILNCHLETLYQFLWVNYLNFFEHTKEHYLRFLFL